jgi:DNA mismatch endonuclease (patch repair protein)
MSDVFTKAKRSEVMSRIRSRGNKDTEVALAKLFRRHKITGWRRDKKIFGKPDFVFLNKKLAVFVDGCFWHGCLKHSKPPRSNQTYWRAKMIRNKTRDYSVSRILRKKGWRVLRIWEHELSPKDEVRLIKRLRLAGVEC